MQELEQLLYRGTGEGRGTSAVEALHDIAQQVHRRSLVVVFSDMMDSADREDKGLRRPAAPALQQARRDPSSTWWTARPSWTWRWRTARHLRGPGNGRPGEGPPAEVRDEYRKAMAERWHRLKLKCGQYRIELVEADINAGFEPILTEFLLLAQQVVLSRVGGWRLEVEGWRLNVGGCMLASGVYICTRSLSQGTAGSSAG